MVSLLDLWFKQMESKLWSELLHCALGQGSHIVSHVCKWVLVHLMLGHNRVMGYHVIQGWGGR